MSRRYSLQFVILIAGLSIGATLTVLYFSSNIFSSEFQWKTPAAKIGSTVVIDNVTLRVVSVSRTAGAAPVAAPTGQEYIIPSVFIGNNTGSDLQVAPLLHFHLKDDQGRVYNIVANPNQSPQLSGPLTSGDSLQEELSFLVPAGTQNLVLLYEPGQVGQSVARILLSS